jgi:hypothetical protein
MQIVPTRPNRTETEYSIGLSLYWLPNGVRFCLQKVLSFLTRVYTTYTLVRFVSASKSVTRVTLRIRETTSARSTAEFSGHLRTQNSPRKSEQLRWRRRRSDYLASAQRPPRRPPQWYRHRRFIPASFRVAVRRSRVAVVVVAAAPAAAVAESIIATGQRDLGKWRAGIGRHQ